MIAGSLYLLQEAGALLASGATAGAFLGNDASPPFMPRLPWDLRTMNRPPPLATPPIMTRIPPGTPPPPSPYGEAGTLMDAGWPIPPGTGQTQAQWDAMTQQQQQAVIQELQARGTLTPGQAYAAQASVLTPAQQQAIGEALTRAGGCPPGYTNLGGGEFPNHCVPSTGAPAPVPTPMPPSQYPPRITRVLRFAPPPLPPAYIPPATQLPPPAYQPPGASTMTFDRAPSGGGGGGGGGGIPWGTLAVGGAVLAFLYAGREKKKRRRH